MTPVSVNNDAFTDVIPSGKDSYSLAYGRESRPISVRSSVIGNANAEWGLKHSLVFDAVYEDCTIQGGLERAFDQVRGGNVVFRRCKFVNLGSRPPVASCWDLGKECDIGIKAGIRDVLFDHCEMNDVLIGDYSIYDQVDRPKARRITWDGCTNPNGRPIIVRGRYCEADTLVFTNTRRSLLVWPKWVTYLYFAFNRLFGDKRVISPDQFVISDEERV